MKKNFLSLMMAAAVVATTSVSAFADESSWPDKRDQDVEVNITGDVTSSTGQTVSGTLSVSVPTATTFTVGQTGTVTTSPITVQNRGTQAVDVYAYKFSDNNPTTGITVVGKKELANAVKYSTLSLRLNGTAGDAYLKSEQGKNGVYTDENCETAASTTGVKLVSVGGNKTDTITLEGTTKTDLGDSGAPDEAIQDKFVLTLKFKKANS